MTTTIFEKKLCDRLLGMAFTIHNILGPGLLEHAYEEAFCIELKRACIPFERQKVFALFYKGEPIGGYLADLVVDDKVILELIAGEILNHLINRTPIPNSSSPIHGAPRY